MTSIVVPPVGVGPSRRLQFREWLDALDALGDLQRVEREVDWDLEMGAVTRRSMDLRAPAPLFERIKDVAPGFRALGAPGGLTADPRHRFARVALALGFPPGTGGRALVEALAAARSRAPIAPVVGRREGAPSKQRVLVHDAVNLLALPVPRIHGHDGGRYLQTYGLNILRTPDGRWTNWSINRMMLLDRNHLGCLIPPNQHMGMIHAEWAAHGEPTPVAIAFGTEPALPYVGGMPIPKEHDEAGFLGGYFGAPVELVPAETVALDVPAHAEIVVEGVISHVDRAMEGPMDEYPGYVGDAGSPKPVLTVTAITHRVDPILPFSVAGMPVDENHTGWGIPHAAEVLHLLREAGLPVATCWMVLESANHLMVVTVTPDWHERTGLSSTALVHRVGDRLFHSKPGFGVAKVLLAEDDFDVTDVAEVCWAFSSRVHPEHGAVRFAQEAQNALPVFLEPAEKFAFQTTKVVYDALLADRFPASDRPRRSDLANGWPQTLAERVVAEWSTYGYARA